MASAAHITIPLPLLPEGWSAEKDFKAIGQLSGATQRSIEPVGPHFLAHARRSRNNRTFSEDDRIQAQENAKKIEDGDESDVSEPEDPMMLQSQAKDWKVLPGPLQDPRHLQVPLEGHRGPDQKGPPQEGAQAPPRQEGRPGRHRGRPVLQVHPEGDRGAARPRQAPPVRLGRRGGRRRAADQEAAAKGDYYKLWSKVFKSEARFSKTHPVPTFGDVNSTKEHVEDFYNFWYNFDSWRTFEYLDEDVPDDNENRDQKRHVERKNTNARKKKKAEDNARLRKLLDDASAGDERIKRFRQEANAAKNKKRLDKEAAEKRAAEEAQAKKEADEKAAKEAEERAKTDRDAAKKAKEAAKNAVKKNKRVLKGSVKDANYFTGGDASAAQIDAVLNDVELVQGKIDPDEIAALAGKLNGLTVADEIKGVWAGEVKRLVDAGKLKDGEAKTLA
ncbi:hypothetical protein ACCO45_009769 [Purpureocillium lilacinum]|uniref:Uncharacterized protein n=1 Tax=Purpureocillium lilacinum TaxID=33203 RepID=A0ACC4DLD9_PURLI